MKKALLPLNLSLLFPTPAQLKTLRPVTSLDIFDGPGGNFHDDGLFSTLTFGRVGSPERDVRFGYIPLKLPVFHPVIYSRLIKLKSLYGEILQGTAYATWNPTLLDFERSNELEGETGYAFFVRHWPQLRPAKTGSAIRDLRVELLEKYRDQAFLTELLVMPAGLRDAEIDADGRVSMDEINELYRSVIMRTRNFPDRPVSQDELATYDRTRMAVTQSILNIYEHIERQLTGKHGFIQGRWASRRVFNGTRNVISSLDTSVADLDAPNYPKFNDTVVGLFQAAKAVLPMTLHYLRRGIVGEVFDSRSNNVELVDPQTLKRTWVEISNEEMDRWSTEEGLEKLIQDFSVLDSRDKPVMVGDHYLALVYVDDQQNYRIFRSIEELPEGRDPKWVRPITYVELIYLSGVSMWNTNYAFVTRYPVENYNSSYPSRLYVKTTIVGEMRYELDENWERKGDDHVALEYPLIQPGKVTTYHDSTSVNPARLASLGGD